MSEGAERYNLVLVNPVLACGRLNQTCLASLPALVSTLVPDSGLILPHKLQLWCQVCIISVKKIYIGKYLKKLLQLWKTKIFDRWT